jgi:deazaflavin-dependent oxidoreductase (nitroreductase family)
MIATLAGCQTEQGNMGIFDWIKRVLIPWYTSLGIAPRTVTLEVVGRKSGQPRRVSLSKTEYAGREYFVSLAGESEWVRNLRAAEGWATILAGRRIPVRLVEIPEEERAPVMLAYVQRRAFTHSGAQASRHFFGLGPRPTLEEMQAIASNFIVLRIQHN